MALPLLVNGADCGPVNPLQGLAKTFDRDRGIQQDHFGAGRAGSSKEAFRTQYAALPGVDQDAARFFSSVQSPPNFTSGSSPYDLSALHASLPSVHPQNPAQITQHAQVAQWATDFLHQQPSAAIPLVRSPLLTIGAQSEQERLLQSSQQTPGIGVHAQSHIGWSPTTMGFATRPGPIPMQNLALQTPAKSISHDVSAWDKEFRSQEASLFSSLQENTTSEARLSQSPQQESLARSQDTDELARTAGLLIDTVRGEQNPKFKNSQFMGLMQQLRDREVVIEGNDMVQSTTGTSSAGAWATDLRSAVDVKGKGKARESAPTTQPYAANPVTATVNPTVSSLANPEQGQEDEDPVDAYFRQENADYINYWQGTGLVGGAEASSGVSQGLDQVAEWERLQRDWDSFEATPTGLKPIANYQFQLNNPYLLGEASRTRHHAMHSEGRNSLYESVLEMEAAVQRDPMNARAWFELGVKQQENEREQKAVHALRRALELDPTHLPSWLALAVSHTNEGNRHGTYEAIREWVERNERYRDAVQSFRTVNPIVDGMTQTEQFNQLAECLMHMARSDVSGEIDPDIQIALAILLNTNEEYEKAKDCFTTALAVRPDDWLLYNRVGATLANSGRPDDALQYYYRALELNPAYIRARFNLGISCINLRRYEEAAHHILDALVLQDSDSGVLTNQGDDKRGVTSTALWDSLKTCCLHMQRIDLATICDQEDLDAFRLNFNM